MDGLPTVAPWLPPAEEHARALIAGWITSPRSEYEEMTAAAIDLATIAGHRVVLCQATVSALRAEMKRLGVRDDPAGRTAAFQSLAEKEQP